MLLSFDSLGKNFFFLLPSKVLKVGLLSLVEFDLSQDLVFG